MKYFALSTLWIRELGLCCILHPYLARRARLKAFKSLNPIPPFAFGFHKFFHDTQAIFLAFPFCPHQKPPTIEFISKHKESGSLKQFTVYVGVACATAFIRISLPVLDNNFLFQPAIFLPTWSLIRLKAFFLPLPNTGGKPRYFSCCFTIWAPKVSFTRLGA